MEDPGEVPGGTKNENCSREAPWDGPGKPSGGVLTILGSFLKVKMLLFHGFEMVFQDVMFFDGFSQVAGGDVVVVKKIKSYRVHVESGGSKCYYFIGFKYDGGDIRFVAGVFSMDSFQDFDFKSGGAQGSKTLKILVQN